MILEWDLFFKITIRIYMKNAEFCRKTSKFLPKRSLFVHFLYFFYLNEKEFSQQACLMKYVENEISNSTSHKKNKTKTKTKKRERGAKT